MEEVLTVGTTRTRHLHMPVELRQLSCQELPPQPGQLQFMYYVAY